jgi:hypothetical protein
MSLTRTFRTLTVTGMAAFSMVAASGCFGAKPGDEHEVIREGIAADINGLDYNVYMTRQINTKDAEDRAYYQGPVEDPKCKLGLEAVGAYTEEERTRNCPTNLWGVFIEVCNVEGGVREPARDEPPDFEIEDAQGNKYEPLPNPESNLFQFRPRPLTKGECIPEAGSTAATAPIAGAVFVFRLPVPTTENRPLELNISAGGITRHFELDL